MHVLEMPIIWQIFIQVLDILEVEGFFMQNYLKHLLPIPNNSLGSANNLCKLGNGLGAYIQALLNEAQNK